MNDSANIVAERSCKIQILEKVRRSLIAEGKPEINEYVQFT